MYWKEKKSDYDRYMLIFKPMCNLQIKSRSKHSKVLIFHTPKKKVLACQDRFAKEIFSS